MRVPVPEHVERVAAAVVDAGLKVHKALGPGLLESVYEHCLAYELDKRKLPIKRQVQQPILYDGVKIDAALRIDLVVAARSSSRSKRLRRSCRSIRRSC